MRPDPQPHRPVTQANGQATSRPPRSDVRKTSSRATFAVVLLAPLAALVPAASAPAQGLGVQFGAAGGRTVPVGDYFADARGEGFNAGWVGVGFVALTLPGRPFGLLVSVAYSTNGANDQLKSDLATAIGLPADEQASLLGVNVDLTYAFSLGRHVRPYVLAGVGLYHATISVTSGNSTADNPATKPAWNLGGGLLYQIGVVAPFLEVRFVHVAALSGFPSTTFFPITAGIRLSD